MLGNLFFIGFISCLWVAGGVSSYSQEHDLTKTEQPVAAQIPFELQPNKAYYDYDSDNSVQSVALTLHNATGDYSEYPDNWSYVDYSLTFTYSFNADFSYSKMKINSLVVNFCRSAEDFDTLTFTNYGAEQTIPSLNDNRVAFNISCYPIYQTQSFVVESKVYLELGYEWTTTLSVDDEYNYDMVYEMESLSIDFSQYDYGSGYANGYQSGYAEATSEMGAQSTTAVAIFSGIIDVALLPINFFLACLNFEVFGINIGAMVTATLTIAIVVILFRTIFAGGNGGGDK